MTWEPKSRLATGAYKSFKPQSEAQPSQRSLGKRKRHITSFSPKIDLNLRALYEKALNLLPQDDFSKRGEIHEWLAYAFYRFAFQAESKGEFRERLRQSTVAYEKAVEFYGKLNEPLKTARTSRCNAMIAYIGYWLASEVPEKKRLLDECWQRTQEALAAFKEIGNGLEYGKTYNQLATSAFLAYALEWSFQAGEKIIREAMEHGEQAVTLLSSVGDPCELARAYVKTAFYLNAFGLY